MRLQRISVAILWAGCLVAALQSYTLAEEKQAVNLLPDSTVIYGEITQPAKLWSVILEHPLRDQVLELDAIKQRLAGPEMADMKKGVAFIEQQIGMSWQKGLSTVTKGGIYFAVDSKTQGVALLIKADDQKTLEKLRDIYINIARNDAEKKGKPDPVTEADYRELHAYKIGKATFTTIDNWLIIANKNTLGESIADAYLDGSETTLATNSRFQAARKSAADQPTAWIYFDVETLRNAGVAKKLYQDKTDNPIAEILLGGLLGGLQKTPYVTTSLTVVADQIELSLQMPHQTEWVKEARQYYFGKEKQGTVPQQLTPKEHIFSINTYRDFSGMWLNSADLFVDRIDAKFAQANTVLTTLFSGKDFGEEILGAVGPKVQLVASRQQFAENAPTPAIKLPAFAAVFTLKDSANMRDDMRRTFQSLLGFLNVVGAQEDDRPQLDIEVEKTEGMQLLISKFIPPKGEEHAKNMKIHYNFSPSFAFVKDRMILSSTTPLARELASLVKLEKPQQTTRVSERKLNTEMSLHVPQLLDVVADNRNQLIVQNMLKEGKKREEVEQEFKLATKIASWFKSSSLQVITQPESLQLQFRITLVKE